MKCNNLTPVSKGLLMKSITIPLSIFSFLFVSLNLFNSAESKAKEAPHRELGAHVHGQATLAIAFDNQIGHFEFVAASEGLLGFEHPAKTAIDKKTLLDMTDQFKKNISKYVRFSETLNCTWSQSSSDMVFDKTHSNHSNFVAKFDILCGKSVQGTQLVLDFTAFKKLHDIDVTILVGDLQLKSELKAKPVTIELK